MKKIIIVLGAIVSVFLMVSVVTAVPCINCKTIVEDKDLLTELKEKTEDIKKKNYSGGTTFELMCAAIICLALLFYFWGLEIICIILAKVWEFLNCPLPYRPEMPIIEGPTSGKAGEEYCWTFHSVDPDGDDLMYIVDWGDGNIEETDCYPSCTPVEVCHTFTEQKTYIIKVKAKECTPDGLESNWATYTVTMPRTRAIYNSLFLRFFEQFPILQKILLFYIL